MDMKRKRTADRATTRDSKKKRFQLSEDESVSEPCGLLRTSLSSKNSSESCKSHSEDESGYDSTQDTPLQQAAVRVSQNIEIDDSSSCNDSPDYLADGNDNHVSDDSEDEGDEAEDHSCSNQAREQNSVLAETVRLHQEAVARRLGDHGDSVIDPTENHIENSKESLWKKDIAATPLEFLYSDEARMRKPPGSTQLVSGSVVKNKYLSVRVTQANCSDIDYVWKRTFGLTSRRTSAQENRAWSQFQVAMGQLARFAIANEELEPGELCKPGNVFEIASQRFVFEVFIGPFAMHGTESTACNKSQHCLRFCESAKDFFSEHDRYPNDARRNARFERQISNSINSVRLMAGC